MRACLHEGGALMVAIRDFSERASRACGATTRSRACRPGSSTAAATRSSTRSTSSTPPAQRTHELTLHAMSPLELEAAVLEAGFRVTRSSRVQGRAVIAAIAV